jgi:CRISPR/Cas system endoribonuclease Cas6 (RAMP superfamily)
MTDTFTIHHLRFTAQVETTIEMGAFKGSALRGAWQSHLRTLYCAQTDNADPLHQAMCPVCFLLSRETGSGDDRRPYAFVPPLTRQVTFEPGEHFTFGISLFGQTVQFLPYLVLAVGQMGQAQGLGKRIHPPADGRRGKRPPRRRGTFRLASIEEVNPLNGEQRTLLEEGGSMVQMPALAISPQQVADSSQQLVQQLAANGNQLTLDFLTPTRIVHRERLVHQPHFSPLFARLLDRVSALRSQFAAEYPQGNEAPLSQAEKAHLLSLADRVKLIADETQWWDVKGRSTRLGRDQPLGGFVGRAIYQAESLDIWRPLLPWLLWGQSTQVGKNVVKGCGWYRIANGG